MVSGILLPWLGYLLGGGTAWLLRQEARDILAIAIETGVQNTGLAILALRLSLPPPESDMTTGRSFQFLSFISCLEHLFYFEVVPVAVAIMTPVVPFCILLFQKVSGWGGKKGKEDLLYSLPPSTELSMSSGT